VLEVGEGLGLNFPSYDPVTVERVEAAEPDAAMLCYGRNHIKQTRVPVHRKLEGLLDGVYRPTAEYLTAMLDETRWLSRLVDDLRFLSLAMARQLVLAHGGHTEVESQPGQGATLLVQLPADA
jgi:hypothetical protein